MNTKTVRSVRIPKRNQRRVKPALIGVGVLVAIVVLITMISIMSSVSTVARSSLWLVKVKSGSLKQVVRGSGTLEPATVINLTSVYGGTVSKINTYPGQKVKKGEALVVLSNEKLVDSYEASQRALLQQDMENTASSEQEQQQILEKKAELGDIRDDLKLKEFKRKADEGLYQNHIVSEIDYRSSVQAVQSLKRKLKSGQELIKQLTEMHVKKQNAREALSKFASTEVDRKKSAVSNLTIRAPANGIVYMKADNLEVGTSIDPGSLVLKFYASSDLNAVVRVPSSDANTVAIGQLAKISDDKNSVYGKVTEVSPRVVQDQVAVKIELQKNQAKEFRSGEPVTAEIQTGTINGVKYMKAPSDAISDSSRPMFVVSGSSPDIAVRKKIQFGHIIGNNIIIQKGASPGDSVILSGAESYSDESKLKIHQGGN